jgi:DNA repair exonuclease SbcCD nuclease subunit
MGRTRILHLADLHLGAGHGHLGPRAAERREEADSLLGRLADFALQPDSGIGGIVIAGDLFDLHDPPVHLVERVLHDLGRLEAGGVHTCTVPGNHDEYSYPNGVYRRWTDSWPGTLVTGPTPGRVASWSLEGSAVDLYAMAFIEGRSHPPYDRFTVEPGPARKIAVLHGSLDVAWSDRSLPLRSENLAALGVDYVALGHIHRPMERRVGATWTCYPGRIEGGGFDDPGGAGIVVIDLAADELRPRRLPFESQPVRTEQWNISGLASEDDLSARLDALSDPRAVVRVLLSGLPGFPLRVERLLVRFAPRFFHLEINAGEAETLPPDLEEAAAEPTVRGLFASIATERIAAAPAAERDLHHAALRFGWAAFGGGRSDVAGASGSGSLDGPGGVGPSDRIGGAVAGGRT